MAVPKQHRSKSRQGKARMHIHLKNPQLLSCQKCGREILPHRACQYCGAYRGRVVRDTLKKLEGKERKAKEKELKQAEEPKA